MKPSKIFNCWHFSIALISILIISSSHVLAADEISYQEIEWIELMPEEDLDALLNPPDFLLNIEDGSAQDSVDALYETPAPNGVASRFQQALRSERVITEFDNKAIRVPGFVVPLISDERQNVTEFFIVPYFGACLHMPPPPPNQMIYGRFTEGFKLESLTEPFWFEGIVQIETMSNTNGTSAYAMKLHNIEAM